MQEIILIFSTIRSTCIWHPSWASDRPTSQTPCSPEASRWSWAVILPPFRTEWFLSFPHCKSDRWVCRFLQHLRLVNHVSLPNSSTSAVLHIHTIRHRSSTRCKWVTRITQATPPRPTKRTLNTSTARSKSTRSRQEKNLCSLWKLKIRFHQMTTHFS